MAEPTNRVVRLIDLESASDRDVAALVNDVPATDLVVMVAPAGAPAYSAAIIGQACSDARVMTMAVVLRDRNTDEAALSRTLAEVRPWALNVVVASDPCYVQDILGSFR